MGVLRLFLAVSVLADHMFPRRFLDIGFLSGQLAVQCFFVISGFYMALVLNEKYNQAGDYLAFLGQRFLRLYPSYLVILAFYIFVYAVITAYRGAPVESLARWYNYGSISSYTSKAVLAFVNVSILGQDWLFFLGVDNSSGSLGPRLTDDPNSVRASWFIIDGPSWSLGVEMTFYLMAPLIVRRSFGVQFALIVVGLGAREIMWYGLHFPFEPWMTRFFPLQLCFFVAGSLGYWIYANFQGLISSAISGRPWIFWILGALLLAHSQQSWYFQGHLLLIPLFALAVPVLFVATKNNAIDRFVGELSYSFYLAHVLMMYLVDQLLGAYRSSLLAVPACIVLTTVFSYLFYRFFESKVDRFRARLFERKHPAPLPTSIASSAIVD